MVRGSGMAILEGIGRGRLGNLFGMGLGAELLYSFVIIMICLMIYYGTKELYDLSSYKGIKYFRRAFLFFGVAYFFRSFIKFAVLYFDLNNLVDFPETTFKFIGAIIQFLFIYFSSMAIFYLLYSVISKKLEGKSNKILIFHLIALILALISILTRNYLVYLGLNLLLLAIIGVVVYISYQNKIKKARRNNLYVIYILWSIFWVLNIIDALIPRFFMGFQLVIYLASTSVFLLILYKVLKNVGSS